MTAPMRLVLALILVGAFGLACAGPAAAASPQRIYKDLADNGRLDSGYSRADIAKALDLERVVRTDAQRATPTHRPAAAAERRELAGRAVRRIPFTRLDAALLSVGGGGLLLIGIGLRQRLGPAAVSAGVARR